MHLAPLIHDLAVILAVAGLVAFLFHKIRQPVVLGYVIAGVIVGPHTGLSPLVKDLPNIRIWADLGVIFLMFTLGLEFSFRKLARVGITAVTTALFEVSLMFFLGFCAGRVFDWSFIESLFLGAMISISSTTILIKALDELNLKSRRFAELIFAVLIVEDLIAILILAGFSSLAIDNSLSAISIAMAVGKLLLFAGTWFLGGYFILPRFMRFVGKSGSDEMLMILALGLCLSLVVLASYFNYSVALGAFIMGSILSESTESHRIEELMKPLRDLFAAVFFVSVGMLLDPKLVAQHFGLILVIALIVILGKTIGVTAGAMLSGRPLKTAVQAGFGMAQIGEFSFIIAGFGTAMGVGKGSELLYPVAVAVSLGTTFTTPYMIRSSHRFATWLGRKLPFRVADILARYVAWHERLSMEREAKAKAYRLFLQWFFNGILVASIAAAIAELRLILIPKFLPQIDPHALEVNVIGWIIAMALASPFLWGMACFGKSKEDLPGEPLVSILRVLTVLWVSSLGLWFFPVKIALGITGTLVLLFGIIFFRRLEHSYRWIETRFLSTFNDSPKSTRRIDPFRHLTPWDVHLVRVKVHPNSDFVGQRIDEIQFRKRYGINIVVIQRGVRTLVAPDRNQIVYPKDELLLLGTDEQIELVRARIEKPTSAFGIVPGTGGYELKRLFINEKSDLVGKTLMESHLQERFGAMVVGIERENKRHLNPAPTFTLHIGDAVWLVGDSTRLQEFLRDSL